MQDGGQDSLSGITDGFKSKRNDSAEECRFFGGLPFLGRSVRHGRAISCRHLLDGTSKAGCEPAIESGAGWYRSISMTGADEGDDCKTV